MSSSATILAALRLLMPVLSALTAWRILYLGLHRRYRFFFAFLVFQTLRSVVLYATPNRNAYFLAWAFTQPVMWLFYVLIVLEIYSLVLEQYGGLQTAGRWMLYFALSISLVVSIASLLPGLLRGADRFPILFYMNLIERGVAFSLVLFLLIILSLLTWYPVPLAKNVVVHSMTYSAFFLAISLTLFARNVTWKALGPATNIAFLGVATVCYGCWLTLLNLRGEEKIVVLRNTARPEEERKLVEQLAAMNATLLRAVRK